MTESNIIQEARFNPKVKTYWLLSGALICLLTIVGIPFLLIWIPLGLILTGRYLKRMECVLTTKALKVKKGIMVRVEKTIPLEKITDMALVQGPIMRHMDLHKLTVETAGQSGAGALVSLIGIEDAKAFRETVLAQRDKVADRSAKTASEGRDTGTHEPGVLLEIRDSLLRIEQKLNARNN